MPTQRPFVIVRAAMTLDGYIDDGSDKRLLISDKADFDRADETRAGCDAIFVGAAAVRRDNPRLLIRSEARIQRRIDSGKPPQPIKVTWTGSGDLDPESRFFQLGDCPKLVFCNYEARRGLCQRLDMLAEILPLDAAAPLERLLSELAERGVGRLLVEGGGRTIAAICAADLVDELQLSIAPFFLGDPDGVRLISPETRFPPRQLRLESSTQIEQIVELRYTRNRPRSQ